MNHLRGFPHLFTIVFVLNALTPVFASQGAGDKVLMCTSTGYQWITIGGADPAAPLSEEGHCVFCLAPQHSKDKCDTFFGASLNDSLLYLGSNETALSTEMDVGPTPSLHARAFEERAPPLN